MLQFTTRTPSLFTNKAQPTTLRKNCSKLEMILPSLKSQCSPSKVHTKEADKTIKHTISFNTLSSNSTPTLKKWKTLENLCGNCRNIRKRNRNSHRLISLPNPSRYTMKAQATQNNFNFCKPFKKYVPNAVSNSAPALGRNTTIHKTNKMMKSRKPLKSEMIHSPFITFFI